MSDLDAREAQVDELLRVSGPKLRTAVAHGPVTDFRRPRSRRRGWVIAIATVVVLIIGLVAIGTNRNDQTRGNDPGRLYWQVTDLPNGLDLTSMGEPSSQTGPPGLSTRLNVYATDAAPLGPIVSVGGPSGVPGQDILPAAGGTNFHETAIAGRRAAFADGQSGQRLLYVEVDGHWVAMTSRNTNDATLMRLAAAVVRDADGSAEVPSADLVDGLTLVLPATAPINDLYVGSNFSGIDYANPDGRSLSLRVFEPKPSSRAMLGLQAPLRATKVAGGDGFVGNYSFELSDPPHDFRVAAWERGGLGFRITGFNVTDAEILAAANSVQPVSVAKWHEFLARTGTAQGPSETAPAFTAPAEGVPPGTDPPFTGEVHDVDIDVSVANPSSNEQIWSGTLPTGETWKVDITRVFDSIAMKPEINGAGQGMSYGPVLRAAGEELGCCGPISVITGDPNAAALRITTHQGDRFTIPLHDLPGTDGLRIAAIDLPNGGGPQAAELIDDRGNVLESLPS